MAAGLELPAAGMIRVRGARTHNLRGIDVDLPRDRLVVVTGVSGSGKSSLVFDTLFAEGQRRFLETLSLQTRRFLDRMQRPDVDEVSGLPPTLAVEQRSTAAQPRSTLATLTGIDDLLRLVYARLGTLHCPQCGTAVSQQSPQAIVSAILSLEAGRKVMILAPMVRGRKGRHQEVFEQIVRDGFVRARVDGAVVDAAAPPDLARSRPHDIEAIIDRIVVKDGLRARLQESVELALQRGNGACLISEQAGEGWRDRLYSSRLACAACGLSFPEIEPRTFSFASPQGACPACQGLGWIEPRERATSAPPSRGRQRRRSGASAAPLPAPLIGGAADGGQDAAACPECRGVRLNPAARSVRFAGLRLPELTARTIGELEPLVAAWPSHVDGPAREVVARIAPEVARRLDCLRRLGVGYLTLDRGAGTLSAGEYQRARLAGCLGNGLRGVCYVLDEPTIGLHPRDARQLWEVLCELRDQGNSLVVVEHDLDIVREADAVVDMGPGAGREGGRVVAAGTPAEVAAHPNSITGRFLRHAAAPERAGRAADGDEPGWLTVSGATTHNLQDVEARFPLAALTCVTGVSGSGKTSLVLESLVPLVREALARRGGPPARLTGAERLDRLVEIDQSPLGRNARSNPATASGVWDEVRRLLARTRTARLRGFRAARFSFNAPEGRCAECRGLGTRRVRMRFLPDLEVVCPACRGARFNRQTLEVKYRDKSAADLLALRIDEAREFFAELAAIHRTLTTFAEVGLGYLTLGQPAPTLSGGEAQRIRLAAELSQPDFGRTLYVLDEPTTGLHAADIERLLHLLRGLVQRGQTVIVIEHNLEVIAAADQVIDLGPDGGAGGGRIVAAGSPEQIASHPTSHTGRALRDRRS